MKDTGGTRSELYREAGVDIDLAHDLLGKVKGKIASTRRAEVLAPIGGFGGMFQLRVDRYIDPVLVTSIDSVGTKVMIARLMDRYDTLGHDIVNHCINDIAVQGAEPLYFVDYIGIGHLRSPLYEQTLSGLADACAAQHVALLGGETAEMPGVYDDEFDLVGCITGVVDRDRLVTGEQIQPGHVVVGLASSGLHTNGYSLARRTLFEVAGYTVDTVPEGWSETVGEALLKPHVCYWPAIRRALARGIPIQGIAHITGGGWFDNIKRVLPANTAVVCEAGVLDVPPVMTLIMREGSVDPAEMHRVFNMGMGMAWILPAEAAPLALAACAEENVEARIVGEVTFGQRGVSVRGL